MKQILYLSYDGMTDPLGQSQVLPYLEGLSKENMRFTLISFEKPERFDALKATIQQRCHTAHIHWIPLKYTKKPPVISTMKDVRKMSRLASKLHAEKHFDLVHCRSYISALVGLSLKRRFKIPFLFDMRGFWADERVEGKIWNLNNSVFRMTYNYFKKKEKQFLAESDAVISLTQKGKDEILKWNIPNVNSDKITVIPCCVDTDRFNISSINPQLAQETKDKQQLNGKFVVGYVGSIGTWYLLHEMLLVFKRIKLQYPNAVMVFLTQENPKILFDEAEIQGLDHDDFRAFPVERNAMPTMISLFNCSIFIIKPSFSKLASSPTKQGELMAMGIPIICNDNVGDSGELMRKYHSGEVIPNVELDTLSNFELDFSDFNRDATIRGAHDYFGLDFGIKTYLSVYHKLLNSKS